VNSQKEVILLGGTFSTVPTSVHHRVYLGVCYYVADWTRLIINFLETF